MLMPAARLSTRKILEILRLTGEEHRSIREIADSLGLPHSTDARYRSRFRAAGLPWPLPVDIDEVTLEEHLFARTSSKALRRPIPDWATVHRELKCKGVTLQLLWQEYEQQQHADGYQYTRFCLLYRAWAKQIDPVLRHEHRAGEKVFVDYAGPTVDVVDVATGEVRGAQILVGVLDASNFLCAEATWPQSLPD
jgi:transposase